MKTVSVMMTTYNPGTILERSLKSVREQNYDQKKIEIIVADGGSTDDTSKIVKKYDGKIIRENTGSAEGAKSVALAHAKGEIILDLASDNILPHKNWLRDMIGVFEKEKDITGCYPLRYTYIKKDTLLNRYFALFGVNDPIPYFLKKADRQSYIKNGYALSGKDVDKGNYYLVEFTKNNLPTIGANGFLIKRSTLKRARVDKDHYFHIDINWDLVDKGFSKYAVFKNDIIHATGESFFGYFKKRRRYMEGLYLKKLDKRRYLVYDKKKDRTRIIAFSLYALSIIPPTIDSLKGYRKIKDKAWFLHPVVCFLIFWIYFASVLNWQSWHYLGKLKKKYLK